MINDDYITDLTAEHGEVFTRPWVVDMILDLAGYLPSARLFELTVVEPSCGSGAFVGPIVDRLVQSCVEHGADILRTGGCIRAFDLLPRNAELARKTAAERLAVAGVIQDDADRLAAEWVVAADFLLRRQEVGTIDFVVGNPPYVRLENVPKARLAAYRAACPTMRGRADLYVGFIEHGLSLLTEGGTLAFIVADRWMRNQYGGALRELISESYSVDVVVQMHDVDAFEAPVSAYPAVTVIRRKPQGTAVLVDTNASFSGTAATKLVAWSGSKRKATVAKSHSGARLDGWFEGDGFWPSGRPEDLALVAELERRWPPLEDPATETRVGIGVATGADRIYLTGDHDLVEAERLLPIVTAGDTATGKIVWSGTHLVNPWDERGLVSMADHPRLEAYYRTHERELRTRHVGAKNPERWFRTIDRVDPTLRFRPKLLLPDLKASIHPVLDEGRFYPHHNLYYVVSDLWDPEVLGGILLSEIANLFVGTYCVKMRGGCYRFQAQYLRRIRVPALESIGIRDREVLRRAFSERDVEAASAVVVRLAKR